MRATPRALLVAAILLVPAVLAGCVGAAEGNVRVTPFVGLARAEPDRPTEFALLVQNHGAFREVLPVRIEGLPDGWSYAAEGDGTLVLDGRSQGTTVLSVRPGADALYGPQPLRLRVGSGVADVVVDVRDLGKEPARPGIGAQVRTAGFWENGTLFYTNMKEVRDNPRLTWVELSEGAASDENMNPIKAYVGARGNPVPEPYNSSGYVRLIEGFDQRLREGNGGMRGGESLVVRIPPELAYTLPGREDHRLYGYALTFVIEVVSVDVLEREEPGLPCLPDTPLCDPHSFRGHATALPRP